MVQNIYRGSIFIALKKYRKFFSFRLISISIWIQRLRRVLLCTYKTTPSLSVSLSHCVFSHMYIIIPYFSLDTQHILPPLPPLAQTVPCSRYIWYHKKHKNTKTGKKTEKERHNIPRVLPRMSLYTIKTIFLHIPRERKGGGGGRQKRPTCSSFSPAPKSTNTKTQKKIIKLLGPPHEATALFFPLFHYRACSNQRSHHLLTPNTAALPSSLLSRYPPSGSPKIAA